VCDDKGDFLFDAGGDGRFFGKPAAFRVKDFFFGNGITVIDGGNVLEDVTGFHTRL
jgi:hypothetical protein